MGNQDSYGTLQVASSAGRNTHDADTPSHGDRDDYFSRRPSVTPRRESFRAYQAPRHSFYIQLNPYTTGATLADSILDEEPSQNRVDTLQEMRSHHLIGNSRPMRHWESLLKTDDELEKMPKKLREFYDNQNTLLRRFQHIDRLLDSGITHQMLTNYGDDLSLRDQLNGRQGAPGNIDVEATPLLGDDGAPTSAVVMFAIYINFFINFLLLAGKMAVALLTNSLSVLASLVDSALDFLSTFIIWVSTSLVDKRDWKTKHLYPVGRARLEPIGVLIFSIIIVVSFLKVADESLEKLLSGSRDIVILGTPSIIIMSLTVIVKVFVYIWCAQIDSSAVQALAQDAMSDIVFNTFSMIFPLVGHWLKVWWMDPVGALLLSCYIVYSWAQTALLHINNLTGATASPEDRQVILYMIMRFAESIKYVTGLNAYHAGDRINVEVDIILDEKVNQRDSHDIAEGLQYAIETLPFVERAFVHLDYRRGNFSGHLN